MGLGHGRPLGATLVGFAVTEDYLTEDKIFLASVLTALLTS